VISFLFPIDRNRYLGWLALDKLFTRAWASSTLCASSAQTMPRCHLYPHDAFQKRHKLDPQRPHER